MNSFQNPLFLPFDQASLAGAFAGKILGHVLPMATGSAEPDQGFEDSAVGQTWSPTFGADLMYGKQMFDPFPIGVVHFPRDFFGSFRFAM